MDRREQGGREDPVDAGGGAYEARVHPLSGDPSKRLQRPFGLLGRMSKQADRSVGRVRGDEDAVIGRGSSSCRGEACEAEAETEAQEHARCYERPPTIGQSPSRNERDRAHRSNMASASGTTWVLAVGCVSARTHRIPMIPCSWPVVSIHFLARSSPRAARSSTRRV